MCSGAAQYYSPSMFLMENMETDEVLVWSERNNAAMDLFADWIGDNFGQKDHEAVRILKTGIGF